MTMSSNPPDTETTAGTPAAQRPDQPASDPLLPDWAQETPRRRRLVSGRNALIGIVALIVIGFVVWLNFPFIPDPVILWGRQPETVFDSASTGQAWTMSGRNLGQTRYAADVLDEPQGALAWSVDTGEATLASPIVFEGRIYLGAHFRIAVLDAGTGREMDSMPATGPVGNSLALAHGLLYYTMPDRHLVARDPATQDIRWEYEMGDSTSGPVSVANGIVYAGALDGVTYALNATTGEAIWFHESLGEVRSPPAVDGKVLFSASADRSLYALDSRTGQERARLRTSGSLAAAPVTANGLTYFVSERQLHAMEADALEYPGQYAVTRTWSQLWLWGFPLPPPPSQPGDRWRFGPDYPEGLSSRIKRTEGIISAPAVAGERLYVGDTLGKMYAVDAITGEGEWQFHAEDGIVASPVVVGELVVFGDKLGWLYGLNRADGTERWRVQLSAGVRTDPVYAEGRLLVRTEDGALHAID
jgi:outer membrane protein assembly factor BamB